MGYYDEVAVQILMFELRTASVIDTATTSMWVDEARTDKNSGQYKPTCGDLCGADERESRCTAQLFSSTKCRDINFSKKCAYLPHWCITS